MSYFQKRPGPWGVGAGVGLLLAMSGCGDTTYSRAVKASRQQEAHTSADVECSSDTTAQTGCSPREGSAMRQVPVGIDLATRRPQTGIGGSGAAGTAPLLDGGSHAPDAGAHR